MGSIQPVRRVPYSLKPRDKLYFLHIFKTAGTSLSQLLEGRFRRECCRNRSGTGSRRRTRAVLSRGGPPHESRSLDTWT